MKIATSRRVALLLIPPGTTYGKRKVERVAPENASLIVSLKSSSPQSGIF